MVAKTLILALFNSIYAFLAFIYILASQMSVFTEKVGYRPAGSKKTTALTHEQFEFILDEFRQKADFRMESICLLMGRCIRIGDVLTSLKIDSVYGPAGEVHGEISFQEQKTGKPRLIRTNNSPRLLEALAGYFPSIREFPRNRPLFYGLKTCEPLHDKGVKFLLAPFVGKIGIRQCSPHSFRKYGAKRLWLQGIEIETISQILNHSSVKETRVYLDIQPKEVERAMSMLEL